MCVPSKPETIVGSMLGQRLVFAGQSHRPLDLTLSIDNRHLMVANQQSAAETLRDTNLVLTTGVRIGTPLALYVITWRCVTLAQH